MKDTSKSMVSHEPKNELTSYEHKLQKDKEQP